MERKQQLLNWLKNEKTKDRVEVDREKEKFINQLKGLNKKDLFVEEKKISLWQKIKILLLGN